MKSATVGFRVSAKERMRLKKLASSTGFASLSEFLEHVCKLGLQHFEDKENISPTDKAIKPIAQDVSGDTIKIKNMHRYKRTGKRAVNVIYRVDTQKKELAMQIAESHNQKIATVLRSLLLAWLDSKRDGSDNVLTQLDIPQGARLGNRKDSTIGIRLQLTDKNEIMKIASDEGYSVSSLITALLDNWLGTNEENVTSQNG